MTTRGNSGERRVSRWVAEAGRGEPRVVEIGGVRVVAQCGCEPASAGTVKGAPRQVAVVSAAGERRRAALQSLGRAWARAFDAMVVYESAGEPTPGQGRRVAAAAPAHESLGRSAREILEGARQVCRGDHRPHQRHCKLDIVHALRFALSLCRPGDVIVFSCASRAQWAGALRRLDVAV